MGDGAVNLAEKIGVFRRDARVSIHKTRCRDAMLASLFIRRDVETRLETRGIASLQELIIIRTDF
ncbi:MAG: hypothetical protein VSS75_003445 [Candidatus Parabeggiatoa sp.]|nr:hypothetical protein [Candidatus Parabeggiatoa sp.]